MLSWSSLNWGIDCVIKLQTCRYESFASYRIHFVMLRVKDTIIVDDEGREVILRGAGLGGWMKYGFYC